MMTELKLLNRENEDLYMEDRVIGFWIYHYKTQ